jgi:hypothetical protein
VIFIRNPKVPLHSSKSLFRLGLDAFVIDPGCSMPRSLQNRTQRCPEAEQTVIIKECTRMDMVYTCPNLCARILFVEISDCMKVYEIT